MKKKNRRFKPAQKKCISTFLFVAIALILASCSKGGGSGNDNNNNGNGGGNPSPTDVTAPVLEVYTPAANQVFTSGNTINVTGRVTDDLGLYRGSVRITNDANGQIVKEQLYEIHYVLLHNFNVSYTTSVPVPTDYTVTVFFEDHGYNSATKSVKVKVNP
ncbi:MAG: hypothetical protein HZB42_01050 [Sphingobacteriales bacterium]|nr:hypothetical protein [Sphingobacteriales bacterium]